MLGFERITFNPNVMGGRACIRNMRVTVSLVVNLIAGGMNFSQVLEAYPYLQEEDLHLALRYVAWLAEDSVYPVEAISV